MFQLRGRRLEVRRVRVDITQWDRVQIHQVQLNSQLEECKLTQRRLKNKMDNRTIKTPKE